MKTKVARTGGVLLAGVLCAANWAAGAGDPWADRVYSYDPGTLQESPIGSGAFFQDPAKAVGALSPMGTRLEPSTDVVQVGQGGSITLEFDEPILNNLPAEGTVNPLGIDFVVFGNAFEAGFSGSGLFYREPGYVEVAKRSADGAPAEWYLLLPERWPASLRGGVDSGPGALLSGYADVTPVNGSGDAMLPPENSASAGGDGFLLERAVVQALPGVPLLGEDGQPQYATLDRVDFVRITDALPNDAGVTGGFTTDIDAVVDLPGVTPEPHVLLVPVIGAVLLWRRRRAERG